MDDILEEFKQESNELVDEIIEKLELAEEGLENRSNLEEFGQIVDRIMGGVQTMSMASDSKLLNQIGQYTKLCKIVGYKGSQIVNDEHFYNVVCAFLLDAVDMLKIMIQVLGTKKEKNVKELLSQTFLSRLQWISEKFSDDVRASVATKADKEKKSQVEIDDLLKQLGIMN